jgi:UDP-N-acetylglucosamine--N-acetylmuramyl-(pentapeptide) pyrophosphoryl-undecaprenol N-acetylglucosamine transferase
MKGKTLLIMGGGTGGHVFPGLCVADAWKKAGGKVVWFGTMAGLDVTLVPKASIPFYQISVTGIRGKGLSAYIKAPFQIFSAIVQSYRLIKELKPDVVLSMGGYVAGPGGIASWLLRKPLVIHEQNAIAGKTNRILSIFAKKVFTGFPHAFAPSKKVEWVGNPVREDLLHCPAPATREFHYPKTRILIIGGSQGADKINRTIPEFLSLFSSEARPLVTHQCGQKLIEKTQSYYETFHLHPIHNANASTVIPAKAGIQGPMDSSLRGNDETRENHLVPFIDDMKSAFLNADLLICRAGALTVAEISTVGVPSILIPFRFAVDDHQTANAQFLVKENAAILISEETLSATMLYEIFQSLSAEKLQTMAIKAYGAQKRDATNTVVRICQELSL